MKTMRAILGKAMWVGRAASTVFGLALVLALVFGVTATALAGTGVGAAFDLGKTNSVDRLSSLVGSVSSAMLKVDNNGPGTALDLRVGSPTAAPNTKTTPPMKVDSGAKVANLNADELDGKDSAAFMPARTYLVDKSTTGGGSGSYLQMSASCDPGDQIVSGGGQLYGYSDWIERILPFYSDTGDQGWTLGVVDNAEPSEAHVYAICADLPPLR